MKCPICRKKLANLIPHLMHHGCTEEEAKRMIERVKEFGDE